MGGADGKSGRVDGKKGGPDGFLGRVQTDDDDRVRVHAYAELEYRKLRDIWALREYPGLACFFLPLPRQGIAIMQNHQSEACNHNDTRHPSQSISGPAFTRIHPPPIGKQFSESKSCTKSSEGRVVINP